VIILQPKFSMLTGNRGPLLLFKNNLTCRRIATYSYRWLVMSGLVLLPSLDFFGEGDLFHVKQLSQKVWAGC
jgi:hypothetical protein